MKKISRLQIFGFKQILLTIKSINKHGFTLLTLLDSVKGASKDNAYIEDEFQKLSYNELYEQSVTLSYYLYEKYNIESNSKIIIVGTNSVLFVKSLFAVSGLGTNIILLNPNQKKEYFDSFLKKQQIDLIITERDLLNIFSSSNTPIFCYDEITDLSLNYELKNTLRRKKGSISVLSSGTKGKPKIESRKFYIKNFLNPLFDIIQKLHLKKNKSTLISIPLFHGYGIASLLLSIFMTQKIRLFKKFNPEKTSFFLKNENTDYWITVPLMIQKVYQLNESQLKVKNIISGGDVLQLNIIKTIHKTQSTKLYNLYGTSETGVCTIATHQDLIKYPETIGKNIKGVTVKIKNLNQSEATEDTVGNLFIKCRWSADNKNNMEISTGDLALKNKEGYLFIKGRLDDMIIIGGENVYPIEIENVIYKNQNIEWAKVKKTIDENQMTKIHVDLVMKQNVVFCEREFVNWISNKVPNYMIPKYFSVLENIPDTKLI
ncbi:putative acyl--CoA ligase YhfT [compost metagenome]